MKKVPGKLVLIDDEKFERDMLVHALKELDIDVDLVYYHDAEAAIDYLRTTQDQIFIIICDMNMPKLTGLEFKKAIDSDARLREKSIPFVFSSTAATKSQIEEAYAYKLHGYFLKPVDIKGTAKQIETIINYWLMSLRPDSDLFMRKA